MKIISLIFVLCLISQCFGLTSISFSGNVSTTGGVTTGEYDFRETIVWLIPIDIGIASYTLAGYASAEVTATGSESNGTGSLQVNGDLIIGAVKFYTGTVPVSYLGYIDAQFNANKQVDALSGTDVTSYNYSAAGGFILTAYQRIEELDPSGNVVRTLTLKDLVWDVTGGNSTDGYLHYVTLNAQNPLFQTLLKSGESVTMTFLVSEILGQVSVAGVTVDVTPKTLESVIQINGWSYTSSSNNLAFVAGVGTGSSAGDSTGSVTVASGSGNNQVYANFAHQAMVSGTWKDATVTATSTSDFSLVTDDASIQAQASSVYKGSYNLQVVTISFPAGAESIVYDPTQGSGTPLPGSNNSANTLFFVVLLLAIVILI